MYVDNRKMTAIIRYETPYFVKNMYPLILYLTLVIIPTYVVWLSYQNFKPLEQQLI